MASRYDRRASSASTRVAAIAIATNWLIFVWAVGISQIVQISLGYFINPLLSVVLGMVVFHERLRTLQWVSVALAAAGVVYLTCRSVRCRGSRCPWRRRSPSTR